MTSSAEWQEEEVYFDGDSFFAAISDRIQRAQHSIEVEVYIFENDQIGERIVKLLEEAASRGVAVRALVDGVGSSNWSQYFGERLERSGVDAAVYHPLPWKGLFRSRLKLTRKYSWRRLFGLMNRRNHRKVFLFDQSEAFAGSMNIADCHLREFSGEKAWRDTAVRIKGEPIMHLLHSFNLAFGAGPKKYIERFRAWRRRSRQLINPLLLLNLTRSARRASYRELLTRIRSSKERVWIETAYFVPRRSLHRALRGAARRGVDVRIIVPQTSDVHFISFVSRAYYPQLLKAGIKMYEYVPSMLHAKTVLADEWGLVGSTNLNHRSLLHDLEVDVVLSRRESRDALTDHFCRDLEKSEHVTEEFAARIPIWQRVAGRLLLFVRHWL